MTDINKLIRLNVEIEGLLRVLADRDNAGVRESLAEKFAVYTEGMEALLNSGTHPVSVPDPHLPEVKDQEAESAEVLDETDAATDAIERGEEKQTKKVFTRNTALLKAFTLNDKFRFIRDIFNGNERDFNDTLSLLADMEELSEAEDYLYNDMMLDRENPAVVDFVAVISRYMPA